jgi:predicted AAA+ superfamily ATPase
MGHVFENFVATEIMKNAKLLVDLHVSHFNISGGKEVDFVIENGNSEAIGLEIKLTSSLSGKDFANLRILKETLDGRLKKGVIIYTGAELALFKDDMWAVPVNYLLD